MPWKERKTTPRRERTFSEALIATGITYNYSLVPLSMLVGRGILCDISANSTSAAGSLPLLFPATYFLAILCPTRSHIKANIGREYQQTPPLFHRLWEILTSKWEECHPNSQQDNQVQFLLTLPYWMWRFVPYLHLTSIRSPWEERKTVSPFWCEVPIPLLSSLSQQYHWSYW